MSYCSRLRGVLFIGDVKVGCLAIFDNPNVPEMMLGFRPSMEDDFTIECDLATVFVEKDLAAGVA